MTPCESSLKIKTRQTHTSLCVCVVVVISLIVCESVWEEVGVSSKPPNQTEQNSNHGSLLFSVTSDPEDVKIKTLMNKLDLTAFFFVYIRSQ